MWWLGGEEASAVQDAEEGRRVEDAEAAEEVRVSDDAAEGGAGRASACKIGG
jgi:hypothetical protein